MINFTITFIIILFLGLPIDLDPALQPGRTGLKESTRTCKKIKGYPEKNEQHINSVEDMIEQHKQLIHI